MPLITREGKGSKLTIAEMDGNLEYLASSSFQDGTYAQTSEGGALTAFPTLDQLVPYPFTDAAAGTYTISDINTSGNGSGLVLSLTLTEKGGKFTFDKQSAAITSAGTGYKVGDSLYIPYTAIGGMATDTFTMKVGLVTGLGESSVSIPNSTLAQIKTSTGDGSIVDLIKVTYDQWFFTGSAGTYTVTPTTDGNGSGAVLELVVIETGVTYSIDLGASSIVNAGSGYAVDDQLIIAGADLGGTSSDDGNVTLNLKAGTLNEIKLSSIQTSYDSKVGLAGRMLVGNSGIIADSSAATIQTNANFIELSELNHLITIQSTDVTVTATSTLTLDAALIDLGDLNGFPTEDPLVAGRLWIDAVNGYVLKVSQG
jgi:hypothetical protein